MNEVFENAFEIVKNSEKKFLEISVKKKKEKNIFF